MTRVRIGCVKYLNTLPLVQGLERWSDATLTPAAPSALFDLLVRERSVDVALASLVDAGREADRVTLLADAGVIGCDGPTRTVRLFSRVPFASVKTLHADTESHTSVVLARLLLDRVYHVRPAVEDLPALSPPPLGQGATWPETLLLIGDKVETLAPSASAYPHQLDLGEAWKQLTGLPFVYAAWMCRRGEERTDEVRAAAMVLQRARLHNRTRLDWIVQSSAGSRHWDPQHAAEYLGSLLRYDAGSRERAAADSFVRMARESGLLPIKGSDPSSPALSWLGDEQSVARGETGGSEQALRVGPGAA